MLFLNHFSTFVVEVLFNPEHTDSIGLLANKPQRFPCLSLSAGKWQKFADTPSFYMHQRLNSGTHGYTVSTSPTGQSLRAPAIFYISVNNQGKNTLSNKFSKPSENPKF